MTFYIITHASYYRFKKPHSFTTSIFFHPSNKSCKNKGNKLNVLLLLTYIQRPQNKTEGIKARISDYLEGELKMIDIPSFNT